MPELPDLEVVTGILASRIVGRTVRGAEVNRSSVMQAGARSLGRVVGAAVGAAGRRGAYLWVSLGPDLHLAIRLMRGAWLWHGPHGYAPTPATDLRLTFDDGTDLRLIEHRSPRTAAVWLLSDLFTGGPLQKLGREPLAEDFTAEELRSLVRGRRCTLKRVLTDQSLIAGIGSSYADEILFQARLSPVRYTHTLTPGDVDQLWRAIRETLNWAISEIRSRVGDELPDRDVRDFLRVHGRGGAPCLVCGSGIAQIVYDEGQTSYCPSCQQTEIPAAAGQLPFAAVRGEEGVRARPSGRGADSPPGRRGPS